MCWRSPAASATTPASRWSRPRGAARRRSPPATRSSRGACSRRRRRSPRRVSVDEVAQATVDEAVRSLRACERDAGAAARRVAPGARDDRRRRRRRRVDADGRLAQAIARGEMLVPDSAEEARGSRLAVPLTVGTRAVGGLELAFAPHAPRDEPPSSTTSTRWPARPGRRWSAPRCSSRSRSRAAAPSRWRATSRSSTRSRPRWAPRRPSRRSCGSSARTSASVAEADSAGIYVLGESGEFELLDAIGTQAEALADHFARVPVEPGRPLGDAVRERRAVWLVDDESWADVSGRGAVARGRRQQRRRRPARRRGARDRCAVRLLRGRPHPQRGRAAADRDDGPARRAAARASPAARSASATRASRPRRRRASAG